MRTQQLPSLHHNRHAGRRSRWLARRNLHTPCWLDVGEISGIDARKLLVERVYFVVLGVLLKVTGQSERKTEALRH